MKRFKFAESPKVGTSSMLYFALVLLRYYHDLYMHKTLVSCMHYFFCRYLYKESHFTFEEYSRLLKFTTSAGSGTGTR